LIDGNYAEKMPKINKSERDQILADFANDAVRLNWIVAEKRRQKTWKEAQPNGSQI